MADGALVYEGRTDAQVKVRGMRIELGDIEAAIIEHPLVRETAVTLSANANGAKRLVAYVVMANDEQAPESELRKFIGERLPDYMTPARFVRLEALPLAQSSVSEHLAVLKEAGIVRGTIDGPHRCYCLDPEAFAFLGTLLTRLQSQACC